MIAGQSRTPAALARLLLEQATRAESFLMADWLVTRPDGRTVKDAYAEAARLAWELDKRLGGPEADAPPESPPGTQPKERERRPVLVLTRELRECLGRIAAALEADGGSVSPAGAARLSEIDAFLALVPAPPRERAG